MTTREQLEQNVADAKAALTSAENALAVFDAQPENNVFDTMDNAKWTLEEKLESWAFQDCEGAGNCGSPEYEQEFIVDGQHYKAILRVEYNRHDKTYYYVEESEFEVVKL